VICLDVGPATLPLLVKGPVACPVCEARRNAKTGAQRRWRAKRAGKSSAIDQ